RQPAHLNTLAADELRSSRLISANGLISWVLADKEDPDRNLLAEAPTRRAYSPTRQQVRTFSSVG
ncbi:MAG TPA: hypothetical protein VL069_06240, partial [Opitutus sp.]|nr:hypothetical protein [Opitutus sp.]